MVGWALIGCGDIARKRVAPALRDAPNSRLVSVSRENAATVEQAAKELGAEKAFADWREQVADPEAQAVYVATPVDVHAEQTVAAAEAGKHVLCEKPMAMSAAECDRMIDACRTNGVKLGVAYYRRFYPVLRRIRELLASGQIGRPVVAQINAFERFDRKPGEPRSWLLDPARAGGGPMMDFGSHRIEVFLHLLGPLRLEHAETGRVLFEREVEDTATVLFEADGVRVQLTVTHAAAEPQDTLDVFCSEGSLHVRALNSGDLRVWTPDGETSEQHAPHANFHQPLVEDFLAAILEDREPTVDGATGRLVQEHLDRIYRE